MLGWFLKKASSIDVNFSFYYCYNFRQFYQYSRSFTFFGGGLFQNDIFIVLVYISEELVKCCQENDYFWLRKQTAYKIFFIYLFFSYYCGLYCTKCLLYMLCKYVGVFYL